MMTAWYIECLTTGISIKKWGNISITNTFPHALLIALSFSIVLIWDASRFLTLLLGE